jgi:2-C-methyl-D-erythritol 4-phosphate cytidylyltransferase
VSFEGASKTAAIVPIRHAESVATLSIAGRSVLDHTLRTLRAVRDIGPIVLALEGTDGGGCLAAIHEPELLGLQLTNPARSRWLAIHAALELAGEVDHVVVHEPNRPLVSAGGLSELIRAAREHAVVVTTLPVHSSIKRVVDGRVASTVPRHRLHAAQSPWAFQRQVLVEALRDAVVSRETPRNELDLVRRSNLPVHALAGELYNVPVSSAADARFAELALAWRFASGPALGSAAIRS